MIKYTVDSTLTLREYHVFKNQGRRTTEDYDRNNILASGSSLTARAKRKIKQYISGYFLENYETNSNFLWVTLTVTPYLGMVGRKNHSVYDFVPEYHDKEVVKCLSRYLNNLRFRHGLKNYLWVAERQDGKRNDYESSTEAIHFHCIFDFAGFVDVRNLNLYWLKVLNDAGYAAFSEKAFFEKKDELFSLSATYKRHSKGLFADIAPWASENVPEYKRRVLAVANQEKKECLQALKKQYFKSAFNGIDPMTVNPDSVLSKICYNPVDLEKIKVSDIKKLNTYLTKYVSKNESVIYGRPWAASRGFTSVRYDIEISEIEAEQLKAAKNLILKEYSSSIEIGNTEFVNKAFLLDFERFRKTEVYRKLLDSITTQRLNLNQPVLFPDLSPAETLDFVDKSFDYTRVNLHVNNEVRSIDKSIPSFEMPVNADFSRQSDDLYVKQKPAEKNIVPVPVQGALFNVSPVRSRLPVKVKKDDWRFKPITWLAENL